MKTYQGIISEFSGKWGFIDGQNGRWFFHTYNCVPGFVPRLGLCVDFEVGAPFKLGQKEQAIHVRTTSEATAFLKKLGASLGGAV